MPKAQKRKAKEKPLCIFCQLPKKMTDEHIWGDWLKNFLKIESNKHRMYRQSIGKPNQPKTMHTHIRAGDPLRSKVHVVCEDCNTKWLSTIQNDTREILIPLITGQPTVLGKAQQHMLATWCAMATMTAEYLQRNDPFSIAVPQSDRDWLMNHRSVPANWKIWISRYSRWKWPSRWAHYGLPIVEGEALRDLANREPTRANTQSTAFVVGELYVLAMSSEGAPSLIAKWNWPLQTDMSLLMAQLWPFQREIVWPPQSLTDDQANIAATALEGTIELSTLSLLGRRLF